MLADAPQTEFEECLMTMSVQRHAKACDVPLWAYSGGLMHRVAFAGSLGLDDARVVLGVSSVAERGLMCFERTSRAV